MSEDVRRARACCRPSPKKFSPSLTVSPSLADLPDLDRCPISYVVEFKDLLERIFAEYRGVKRLQLRTDQTIPAEYLVALDVELGAIQQREWERQKRDQKAKEMRSRGRI